MFFPAHVVSKLLPPLLLRVINFANSMTLFLVYLSLDTKDSNWVAAIA